MQRPPASAGVMGLHERHLAVAEATRVVLGSCALYTALSVAAPADDLAVEVDGLDPLEDALLPPVRC